MASPARRAPICSATHPNLDIEIDRGRSGLYGVSTTQLENLLRAAYSQNYVYLIKQADDQYEVIVEADDNRAPAGRFSPDLCEAGRRRQIDPDPRPNENKADSRPPVGQSRQPVHERDVWLRHQTEVALGDVTNFINKTAAEVLPPTVKGELQGEGLVLQQLFQALPFPRHRGRLRHVRDFGNSL
jgi:HAE1 family hydrophobic/amphiphilic exporter-1